MAACCWTWRSPCRARIGHGAQTGTMNPLYWRPGQASSLTIGGNRPNANYFLIDGAVNTDPTFNTQNLSLSPDAVREFQVQTGAYSAELGGAGGGQINIVTKGGHVAVSWNGVRIPAQRCDGRAQLQRNAGREIPSAE